MGRAKESTDFLGEAENIGKFGMYWPLYKIIIHTFFKCRCLPVQPELVRAR